MEKKNKKNFNAKIDIEKIEKEIKEVEDPFVKKLFLSLKEKLEKNKKISYVEILEFNRIENIIEKEKKRKKLTENQKIPEKNLVFVFRIGLTKGIWRTIEIKGDKLLSDLDFLIRKTFDHEPGHLYEFRLGEYRFGPECDEWQEIFDGLSDIRIDSLTSSIGLKVNDKGKYIHDFGENIEHTVNLVEIKEPEKSQKYPKISGNERIIKCEECSANALLWCHTCCMKLCDDCSEKTSKYCREGHYPLLSIYNAEKSQWE